MKRLLLGIIGFMNIKYKKGYKMIVHIPFAGNDYSFIWDLGKRK